MHTYPKRASLQEFQSEIFKLVSFSSTPEQWADWLRVPLEHAAARGNLDLFNALLGAGANGSVGWRGCRGRTLIDAAALGGSADVISALLRAGAQPDVNVLSVSSRRSALYTATLCGHEAAARCLVVAGAEVNFKDPVHQRSVLDEAIKGGHEQLVSDLVIGGANIHFPEDEFGAYPIHFAAFRGFNGMVSTLLLRGADKDARDGDYGETPLSQASKNGHLAVVETLLAAGADFNIIRSDDPCSPLDLAAENGHVDVLKAILGHGADANCQDGYYTPLHRAAINDHAGAIDTLIEAGADIEVKKGGGDTALGVAAYYRNPKAMLTLLQHGAAHTARDDEGNTPLHRACDRKREGMEAAVDLLLRWGADETAFNNQNRSPIHEIDLPQDVGIPVFGGRNPAHTVAAVSGPGRQGVASPVLAGHASFTRRDGKGGQQLRHQ